MLKEPEHHKAYRALLHLYPKTHRQEYGEQMVQTFDDLLQENAGLPHAIGIWLRVGCELPANVIEEHIYNWEGRKMNTVLARKRVLVTAGAIILIGVGVAVGLSLRPPKPFTPTTYANIQQSAGRESSCAQDPHSKQANVDTKNSTLIGNAITTSIIDAHAGTNVDVYFKTYDGSKATGTADYSGSYGSYNFTAEQSHENMGDYMGGWVVTRFKPCKA